MAAFPLAGKQLHEHHFLLEEELGVEVLDAEAWISLDDLIDLRDFGKRTLMDNHGNGLARLPSGKGEEVARQSFRFVHPWDLLRAHELALASRAMQRIGTAPEDLPAGVHVDGWLEVGEGTKLLSGVFIQGPVQIGKDCRIGPNCYIRGPVSIGDGCVVGHAVEFKNVVMLSDSHVAHLSYVGDSVIGRYVNLGGGTIVANYRHDGASHRSWWNGELLDTGRLKFGAIIGDDVMTGVHTTVYPGRKLAQGARTLPGQVVKSDLGRF